MGVKNLLATKKQNLLTHNSCPKIYTTPSMLCLSVYGGAVKHTLTEDDHVTVQ